MKISALKEKFSKHASWLPPESIEWFIEDQPLSLSYDLAPPHPLSPLSRQQVLSLCQSSCVVPVELADRRVGGGGLQDLTGAGKPGPLQIFQYSLLTWQEMQKLLTEREHNK